jgi:type IV pilus assembly protein PilF
VKWITAISVGALAWALAACTTTSSSQNSQTDPHRASQINLDLAVDYLRKGNLAQAKEKLDRALEQNSRNAAAHSVAGLLYDRLADTDKADSHYQRAVALDSENSEYKNNYAVFLCQKNRYAKGEKMALEAAANRLYKTPEVAYLNAGTCARSGGNLESAEKHFRQALAIRPRFAEALFQLADLEYGQKNYMSARAFLERYSEVGRTTPATLWLGVQIERSLGNHSVAEHYAQRLKREYPNATQTRALVDSERDPG